VVYCSYYHKSQHIYDYLIIYLGYLAIKLILVWNENSGTLNAAIPEKIRTEYFLVRSVRV